MAKQFDAFEAPHLRLIEESAVYFVASAGPEGRVNLSPKGLDSLRVLSPTRVGFMNLTGSGNETAGHLLLSPRITLMWCSFGPKPMILRAYGSARAVHPGDADWPELSALFPATPSNRQVIDVAVDLVQSSCGYAVPLMSFEAPRDTLTRWAEDRGPKGLHSYREDRNLTTIDGYPTGLKQEAP